MKRVIGLLMIMMALLLAACSAPAAPPTEVPVEATVAPDPDVDIRNESGVPGAMLTTSEGVTQIAEVGSYCWDISQPDGTVQGVCADAIGVIAPSEALPVSADETLTFTLTAGQPSNVQLRVLAWQVSDFDVGEDRRVIDHEAPVVASGNLDASQTIEWQAPSEPGEYALALFSSYQPGGDISYGWHIIVE